jgi:protein O-mannosyl-transferase
MELAKTRKNYRSMHLLLLSAVLFAVAIAYAKIPTAYFCSYDDFLEVHRAAFEDTRNPSKIVTTPHFYSYKYRPFNRGINFLTYAIGDQDAKFFRVRNVAFHLLNVVLVYVLAWKLFGSLEISAVAATLFGLHPIANQSVIGSVMTNTVAHSAFLGALLMVMRSIESRHWWLWLIGGVICGWISLMAYDPNIVVFGLIFVWLAGQRLGRGGAVSMRSIGVFVTASVLLVGLYFGLRELYVPSGWTRAASSAVSAAVIAKNAIMYAGSMLSPVDIVLANEWLNAPLPPDIASRLSWAIVYGVLLLLTSLGFGFLMLRWLRAKKSASDKLAVVLLILGTVLPLSTLLVFQSHPSETYLYLPAAFFAILLSYALVKVLRDAGGRTLRHFYAPAIVLLVVLFATATWVRNNRVCQCAETAQRILSELPDQQLSSGRSNVLFANMPGENGTKRYGFYGFRGIHTIAHTDNRAITSALQLVYHNELLTGKIVEPGELIASCGREPKEICVLVHWDGQIEYWSSGAGADTTDEVRKNGANAIKKSHQLEM